MRNSKGTPPFTSRLHLTTDVNVYDIKEETHEATGAGSGGMY